MIVLPLWPWWIKVDKDVSLLNVLSHRVPCTHSISELVGGFVQAGRNHPARQQGQTGGIYLQLYLRHSMTNWWIFLITGCWQQQTVWIWLKVCLQSRPADNNHSITHKANDSVCFHNRKLCITQTWLFTWCHLSLKMAFDLHLWNQANTDISLHYYKE